LVPALNCQNALNQFNPIARWHGGLSPLGQPLVEACLSHHDLTGKSDMGQSHVPAHENPGQRAVRAVVTHSVCPPAAGRVPPRSTSSMSSDAPAVTRCRAGTVVRDNWPVTD